MAAPATRPTTTPASIRRARTVSGRYVTAVEDPAVIGRWHVASRVRGQRRYPISEWFRGTRQDARRIVAEWDTLVQCVRDEEARPCVA